MKNRIGTPYEQGRYGMKEDILALIKATWPNPYTDRDAEAIIRIIGLIHELK